MAATRQQKTYRVRYTVMYDGLSPKREVEVMANTLREARSVAALKIYRLEPEADDFIIQGNPELIV